MLHTLLTLLEAILPCMQQPDEKERPTKSADPKRRANELKQGDEEAEEKNAAVEDDSDSEDEHVAIAVADNLEAIRLLPFTNSFIFSLIWAIGGYLEDREREKLESYLVGDTELELPSLPPGDNIFDYNVNPASGKWSHWNSQLSNYTPPEISPQTYGSLLIPNVGSIRTEFLMACAAGLDQNVLLIGEQGSAKTTLVYSYLKKKNPEENVITNSNFSSSTTPQIFQKSIEALVDKRMGTTYGPPPGKRMFTFIDDLNLPEVNSWGDQCTNEFFRAMIEQKGFYSLEKPGDFSNLVDVQYMAAMNHPGGGRNDIPHRLKRHFVTFNCTIPTEDAIDHIFGTIANGHFNPTRGFNEEVVSLVGKLVPLTRLLWKATKDKMLPTPAKFHYVFNLRDLSRIWLGMIGTKADVISSAAALIHLWRHEMFRVIADRFVIQADKDWFDKEMVSSVRRDLGEEAEVVAREFRYFVDFMRDAPEPTGEEGDDAEMESPKVYEPVDDFTPVVARLNSFQDQYNEILRGSNMDLVFFPDAIINLIKISRIIRNPGGNMMLVGVGGSGKQSLTKLASFIAGYRTFQITLTRTYNTTNFLEDIKLLFRTTGVSGTGTTFLFTDQDIKEESFLEYINNVLAGGLITSLYTREEQGEIVADLMPIMKRECPRRALTPDSTISWFLDRVRSNLHIVLCFSPVGEKFRSRALKFPGLISGCTINWFQPWPRDALISVAKHFLDAFPIQCGPDLKTHLFTTMADVQGCVSSACSEYYSRFRRSAHVTPKSFLNFINSYKAVYASKEVEIEQLSARMNAGLNKLNEASKAVEILKRELAVMEKELEVANTKAQEVLVNVTERARYKLDFFW